MTRTYSLCEDVADSVEGAYPQSRSGSMLLDRRRRHRRPLHLRERMIRGRGTMSNGKQNWRSVRTRFGRAPTAIRGSGEARLAPTSDQRATVSPGLGVRKSSLSWTKKPTKGFVLSERVVLESIRDDVWTTRQPKGRSYEGRRRANVSRRG